MIIRGFRRVDRVRRHPAVPLERLRFVTVPFLYMVTRAGGISLEVRGGDERHREFADPFRRSESPWSATEYPMARLFHDRLSEPEAVGFSLRILRLGCDIKVDWASFSYPVTSASPDGRQPAVFG